MKILAKPYMPGFSPCKRCGEMTLNDQLFAFEDKPRTYYDVYCLGILAGYKGIEIALPNR